VSGTVCDKLSFRFLTPFIALTPFFVRLFLSKGQCARSRENRVKKVLALLVDKRSTARHAKGGTPPNRGGFAPSAWQQ
jgi:hypothetical protein